MSLMTSNLQNALKVPLGLRIAWQARESLWVYGICQAMDTFLSLSNLEYSINGCSVSTHPMAPKIKLGAFYGLAIS